MRRGTDGVTVDGAICQAVAPDGSSRTQNGLLYTSPGATLDLHHHAPRGLHQPGLRLVGAIARARADGAAVRPAAVARHRSAALGLVAGALTAVSARPAASRKLPAILLVGAVLFGLAA